MKNFVKLLLLFLSLTGWGQIDPTKEIKITPDGYFENIFDQYGNKYDLKDLIAGEEKTINNTLSKSTMICSSGMFDLYFETGSGMENTSDATHNARRSVVCQVFNDLTNFINSPLKNGGNTTRVKIWIRNINNISGVSSNALGLATSFYTMPYKTTTGFGGIVDGEIWKTIQAGKDSYINTSSPLVTTNGAMNSSGLFYHGMMSFNFTSYNWNTDLLNNSGTLQYDLYSVVLHEVTHALGFNSLLKSDGTSVFGNGYNYFSRYDSFLKTNDNSQFIIKNTSACSSMYNYSFNSLLSTTVLQPNTSNCITDQTTCSNAIKFIGTNTVPIYTPNCYESGSSYSHFEDSCISGPNNGNNTYFVMSNANGTGSTFVKHFLKTEERNALIDIGYSLNTTYGNNSIVLNSFNNYGGTAPAGNNVAGINDGIATNGGYSFIGNSGVQIAISGILSNDYNATSFECLEDVFSTSTLSVTSGTTATNINFNSTVLGLHLLRYVPINATGKRGNITYIYVYVRPNGSCAIPNSCDLVMNGDFEQKYGTPTGAGGITLACGWSGTNNATPDYFHTLGTNNTGIPCNFSGIQGSHNNSGNAYAGMANRNNDGYQYSESIVTKLKSPLQPNTSYQLKFDASLAEGCSSFANILQAYFSTTAIHPMSNPGDLPITNSSMLFKNDPIYSRNTNSWDTIVFNFTTGAVAGEEYLYLGGIQNVQISANNPAVNNQTCNYNNLNSPGWSIYRMAYYYIDNVSLIQLNGATFNLPDSLCNNQTLSNLETYLSGVPTNGVFTGSGVTNSGGLYSLNAATAGAGNHTITYTYINSSGCSVSIADTITINAAILPTFDPVVAICPGATVPTLPNPSNNGISGTWALVSGTTYSFTPNANQCGTNTTLTVPVLSANDPNCTSCFPNLTLNTPETNTSIVYKRENWIETNTNYEISGNKDIKMKAGDYIALQPGTYIKNDSEFLGEIEDCTATSKLLQNKEEAEDVEIINRTISIYPNPTQDFFTINSSETKLESVEIMSIEGKVIFTRNSLNNNKLDVDFSKYQNGIYIVNIITIDNKITSQKIIKN